MFTFDKKVEKELDNLYKIAYGNNKKITYLTIINMMKELNCDLNSYMEHVLKYFSINGIEIDYGGFEEENINDIEYIDDKIKPFDQTKINISMKTTSLDNIIKRIINDEVDLMPDFQRKAGLWSIRQKSRLIESLMLRIPLPAFYFDGTKDNDWLIIDGLQRLTAIKEFFVDKTLILDELEFMSDFKNCGYEDLPRTYIRRMEETEIVSYIINPGTPANVKYNIFKRINTSGLELEPQEIRHALYQGKSTKLLLELSDNDYFKYLIGDSIKKDRMQDRELILRFIAFREYGIGNYNGKIEDFLNETMEIINKYDEYKINEIKNGFDVAMNLSFEVFGDKAFRKIYSHEDRKNPINRALFEVWSVAFSNLNEKEIKIALERKEEILDKFIDIMNDSNSNFSKDISSGKIIAVKRRLECGKDILREVVSC